ncbi:von Willebrand factor type A [Parafrankia sp. EAN1pec]|nr:von Willebrand factor type A [Frankia sp. EAN1pec]
MPGARHRHRRSGPSLRGVAAVAAVPLMVGALTCGWLVLRGGAGPVRCDRTITLGVTTSPSLATALSEAAAAYGSGKPTVSGYCVSVRVDTAGGGQVASYMRGGWTDPTAGPIPDVWVPDSTDWLTLARTTEPANRLLVDTGTVIATSPVVIAMPRPMAEVFGWPRRELSWADLRKLGGDEGYWGSRGRPAWGGFTVGLPDPRVSAAGMTALADAVAAALKTPVERLTEDMFTDGLAAKGALLDLERSSALVAASDTDLLTAVRAADLEDPAATRLTAFPLQESLVYQYNRRVGIGAALPDGRGPELAAFYPRDGTELDEIRYTVLSRASDDPVKAEVARDFLRTLTSGPGRVALLGNGLRPPDGIADSFTARTGLTPRPRMTPERTLDATVLTALQGSFAGVHQRGNTLAVLDTSGSMNEEVPGSAGRSRLSVALDAAKSAIPLFAEDSDLGLWQFSTRLRGDQDWEELVPLGPMGERLGAGTRSQAVMDAVNRIEPRGDTGLYDTALAAFRYMNQHYVPGRPNQVVLLTDGKNSDPGSIALDELVRILRREYSPQRPVQVITIGYGADTDLAALSRISAATGAETYPALDPNTIFEVLVDALTEVPG